MKRFHPWTPVLAALSAACLVITAAAQDEFDMSDWSGTREMHSELAIHADGGCEFKTETIQSRAAAEQQVRMMERIKKMSEATESGDETVKPDLSTTNDVKPFTDEELSRKMSETMDENNEDPDQKVNVEVKKDDVVITTMRSFASIEDLLKNTFTVWAQSGIPLENVRFETASNGLLQVTLTPRKGMERYLKTYRAQWKLAGAKTEFKLVFPGKVVSSGFPAIQTNATWIDVDSKDDKSLDAMAKLYAAPTVITAEAGGLKLNQPLESKHLSRLRGEAGMTGNDLPITDAGPGFVAEAGSITTTTLHVFPGGEEYFQQNPVSTGAVVSVKLFAPKGRILKSVSNPRVISAVDNKGRSVVAETDDNEEASTAVSEFRSGGSQETSSMGIELRLALPQPDAQSIDKLSGEVEALTVGAWKEMTLTNLEPNPTNELDLSEVLPGAKMVITKVTSKDNQFSLQATLKGPAKVQRLDVRAKVPGNDQFNSYCSDRRTSVKGSQTTRSIAVQGYGIENGDSSSASPVVIVVRYPEDLMRQRVKFELKGLDLL